jgi:hypothetical protein
MAEIPDISKDSEGTTNSPEKDRRSGEDRRKNTESDYSGPERRSGTDRRGGAGQ